MRLVLTIVLLLVAVPAMAAEFGYIDEGDIYQINRFGKNNSTVMVVRKLDAPRVKVQDLNTGITSVEDASALLSEAELRRKENSNKAAVVGGVGLGLCVLSGKC